MLGPGFREEVIWQLQPKHAGQAHILMEMSAQEITNST